MTIQASQFIGDEQLFSVHHRIFNIILLFAIVLCTISSCINFVLDLGSAIFYISVSAGILSGILYYFSFYRRKFSPSASLFVFICILVFTPLIWFFNGGINGGTMLFILLFSTMSTALFTGKKRIAILLLVINVTLVLLAIEYLHPDWIVSYSSRLDRFADLSLTMILEIIANSCFIAIILNFYINEQIRSRKYLAQIEMQRMELKFRQDLEDINEKLEQQIEDRKEAEASLIQSRQLFVKTFKASPIPMCVFDAATKALIDVNDSFIEVFKYVQEELKHKAAADIFQSEEIDAYFNSAMEEKAVVHNVDITFYTSQGLRRMGLLAVEQVEINDRLCLLCVINDITERVQMNREMERLDRLNLVGEMAASIGHEVRNPLTTVRGFLQLFQKTGACTAHQEYLTIMIEELDRANSIITEFLSLAKNKRIQLVPHNLNAIISKIHPLLQADALASGKAIELALSEIPDILLDENEIRQCILNLVRNGLEAVSAKGIVIIRTYLEESCIVLAIRDNGQGIPAEIMSKFGTPFLTTKEKGTGLGIPICYRIAERHQASITIQTSDTGTTFYIKFNLPK